MKMLIFVVTIIMVASVVLWRVRKADAERQLAREKELHRKERERKKAVTPARSVTWPTIIRPDGKHHSEGEQKLPEPSMSSIKFRHVDLQDLQRRKAATRVDQGHS